MQNTILSVGYIEFPYGLAQVQRQMLLAKAILHEGFEVTVLCRYGNYNKTDAVESKGIYEGINYIYCSGSSIRPDGFIKRNILKISGFLNEIRYFRRFSSTMRLAGVLITTNSFHNIILYYLLGKFFGVPTVIDNVEYWTSIKGFRGLTRLDKYLYDKYYFLFADGIICISDFLISKVRKFESGKVIKIPVITDFDKFVNFKASPRLIDKKYFLYCGSDVYFEVIDFVISSYEQSELSEVSLVLVTKNSGRLRNRIQVSKKMDMIYVLNNLVYNDLINLYKNSEGLIIPMRNTDQDKARFPHKISEYCASSRPIITNCVGEIENYFNDTNAYLCSGYDEKEYAEAMERIISHPDESNKIAEKSYQTGIINFNYISYSKQLIKLYNNK